MRLCDICQGNKAVGKQTLTKDESPNPGTYLLCRDCAPRMEQIGANITYFHAKDKTEADSPSLPQVVLDCEHDWKKHSLVSEVENKSDRAFDWCRCQKCKVYGKRFYLTQTNLDDLMMEIDIACCR
ncbi:hypothetical protein [Vibrio owensii]|uniref:hypothetical protein n=1 Tax=Vibrio owensii TaxID=696485 RepID=UPI0018F1176D|nr:hypothetical protein [Vibrio owensii]